jgi:hypothetical protein
MRGRPDEKTLRRQIAVRQMFLDANGRLSRNGRVALFWLKYQCHARRADRLVVVGPNGVDPIATVAAAARRELLDQIIELLNLDDYVVVNTVSEED